MANGTKGDHPLTDLFIHNKEVYGKEIDDLIRKIESLSSSNELYQWWEKEIGWQPDYKEILPKAKARYELLVNRAKDNGWEN